MAVSHSRAQDVSVYYRDTASADTVAWPTLDGALQPLLLTTNTTLEVWAEQAPEFDPSVPVVRTFEVLPESTATAELSWAAPLPVGFAEDAAAEVLERGASAVRFH